MKKKNFCTSKSYLAKVIGQPTLQKDQDRSLTEQYSDCRTFRRGQLRRSQTQ